MKHKIDPTVDCVFKNYLLYEQRLDAERLELTWKSVIEQKTAELEKERREKERLLALLKKAGIDPNQIE